MNDPKKARPTFAAWVAAVRFLKEKAEEETGVFSETIPRYKARKALASIGLG